MPNTIYELARIGVDAVIFTVQDGALHVILHTREKEPFKRLKELPGGLLRGNETAEQALQRKLVETLGEKDVFFQQFYTFTNPTRDPRERTVSIGFIALVSADKFRDLDAWSSCGALPPLAFDHQDIIHRARGYLKDNISSLIVMQFMPKFFPLNRLQEVYETIEGKTYDNRNFRKRMTAQGVVVETVERENNVSHRPAKLYSFAAE